MIGQQITTLVDKKTQMAGTHNVDWNGTDYSENTVAAGIYFYRLQSPAKTITHKMLLLK